MTKSFRHIDLELPTPKFESKLTDSLMELNFLKRKVLFGTTKPFLFFQLKKIFHILESIGSARIEGNRTTIAEYIDSKLINPKAKNESELEIENLEKAVEYLEEIVNVNSKITHKMIRELHQITVNGLEEEGDKNPGAYRNCNVTISQSPHTPPEPHLVQKYMDELLLFINEDHSEKYDAIKIAISHHRFAWVHPFGNGNGRVVRLLTYALLIKYGFRVKDAQLINPNAVFYSDRENYYEMLSKADSGEEDLVLEWCEYVVSGICGEIEKINKLLDHQYLLDKILRPALIHSRSRKYITEEEEKVLRMGVRKQRFKAADISEVLPKITSRQRTFLITKLKDSNLIMPIKQNGREYFVLFHSNYIMRSLIKILESENFIPPID